MKGRSVNREPPQFDVNVVTKESILQVDKAKKHDCLFDLLLSIPPARTKKHADFYPSG